jgi:uncharacterized protein YggE
VVVTSGEGVVQTAPDRAWMAITAESRAGSAREALQASEAPPIAAGQIELRSQVTLTAELK